MPMLASRLI